MTRMRLFTLASGLALLVLGPAVAHAQAMGGDRYGGAQPAQPATPTAPAAQPYGGTRYGAVQPEQPMAAEEPTARPLFTPFGMDFMLGGGVTGFSESTTQDFTDTGGMWDARLAIGTKSIIGAEVAYVGTANNVTALGLDSSAFLLSSSVEGDVRVNIGTWQVQPFVFGGAAYVHYSVENSDFNTSDISDSDDVFAIPVGGGATWRIMDSGFTLDARFTYRFEFDDDLFRSGTALSNTSDSGLDNWNVSARIGYEF